MSSMLDLALVAELHDCRCYNIYNRMHLFSCFTCCGQCVLTSFCVPVSLQLLLLSPYRLFLGLITTCFCVPVSMQLTLVGSGASRQAFSTETVVVIVVAAPLSHLAWFDKQQWNEASNTYDRPSEEVSKEANWKPTGEWLINQAGKPVGHANENLFEVIEDTFPIVVASSFFRTCSVCIGSQRLAERWTVYLSESMTHVQHLLIVWIYFVRDDIQKRLSDQFHLRVMKTHIEHFVFAPSPCLSCFEMSMFQILSGRFAWSEKQFSWMG